VAQQITTLLIDDIDGTEASETIKFSYQGIDYEIDLNNKHTKALDESFQEWIEHARRVGGRRNSAKSASKSGLDTSAIRAWARENGYNVNDRGRVAADIIDAYLKAKK
jgi:hypothetical protein